MQENRSQCEGFSLATAAVSSVEKSESPDLLYCLQADFTSKETHLLNFNCWDSIHMTS